ncbi:unnamed protein product [Phytomonas sp. EM1]|nr:unnamed protein product [Phytomonas sp. EM1]|eukprot:CCW62951.1 unnamed protein product [Phytomonas sp. isolate EM1]
MNISNSTLRGYCPNCGRITESISSFTTRSDHSIERGLYCMSCYSLVPSLVALITMAADGNQIRFSDLANNSILNPVSDGESSQLELPEGCCDFTTNEILHVLTTFKSGLPPEEVQNFVDSHVKKKNDYSVDPGCYVESEHPSGCMENGTSVLAARPENPLASTGSNKHSRDEVKGHSQHEDLTADILPCSICLVEILGSTECIVKLFCGHYYHQTCLRKWLEERKYTCPMCRKPLIVE